MFTFNSPLPLPSYFPPDLTLFGDNQSWVVWWSPPQVPPCSGLVYAPAPRQVAALPVVYGSDPQVV